MFKKLIVMSVFLLIMQGNNALACCGDPDVSGTAGVSDVLRQLLAITGQGSCVLSCCDVDNDGALDTTDALINLRSVTGAPELLVCPDTLVTFTIDSSVIPFGGILAEWDYSATGIEVIGTLETPGCAIVGPAITSYNNLDSINVMRIAAVQLGNIPLPMSLIQCGATIVSHVDPALTTTSVQDTSDGFPPYVNIPDAGAVLSMQVQ